MKSRKGQALFEVLVAVAVVGIIIGSAVIAITVSMRANTHSKLIRSASLFLQEMMDNARSVAEGDWHALYNLTKDSPAYIVPDAGSLIFVNGTEGVLENNVTAGLVGHWKLDEDESSGINAYDSSGNDNKGILTNGPVQAGLESCRVGGCLSFDGTNDYVNVPVPHNNFPTTAITVSTWVKLTAHISWNDLIRNNWGTAPGAWLLFSDVNGSAIFGVRDGGLGQKNASGCSAAFTLNNWHMFTGTYDGSTVRVYLDGVQCVTTSALSGQSLYTSGAIGLGELSAGAANHFLDDVRIYNRALTASEISQLYGSLAFSRSISVSNVERTYLDGPIVESGIDDPSTQKITGSITWPNGSTLSAIEYLTRSANRIEHITDWSTGTYSSASSEIDFSVSGQVTLNP